MLGGAEGWNRDLKIVPRVLGALGDPRRGGNIRCCQKGLFRQILDEETWRVRFWVGVPGGMQCQ